MKLFQPQLTVTPTLEFDEYDVKASVWVPDGCHVANGTDPSFPKDLVGLPEIQPLQLFIEKRSGVCIQAFTEIHFEAKRLNCAGKYNLLAFSMLNEVVMGTGSSILPCQAFPAASFGAKPEDEKSGASIQQVAATANAMPGTDPEMWVIIQVLAPMGGFEYEIVDLGGFGFTGRTLLLDLNATVPDAGASVISSQTLRFHKRTDRPFPYDSVAVHFEGEFYLTTILIAH